MQITLKLALVIRDYSRLDPSQSRLVKTQINEIWKQLVTSDHHGAVICETQFHLKQGERAPKKVVERFNDNILYSLLNL